MRPCPGAGCRDWNLIDDGTAPWMSLSALCSAQTPVGCILAGEVRADAHRIKDVAAHRDHRPWQLRAGRFACQGGNIVTPPSSLSHDDASQAAGGPRWARAGWLRKGEVSGDVTYGGI